MFWPLAAMLGAACEGPPAVPARPTWGDVAPILQGQCNHCHGATARTTGTVAGVTYRFDFFDMSDTLCGEAAAAMDVPALAAASATLIRDDVTSMDRLRPRMPPAPGAPLFDWQREIIQRWAENPVKGPPPRGNRKPRIEVNGLPALVKSHASFIATTDDPDNDSVIGVIQLGDMTLKMNHPGTFAVRFDTTTLTPGVHRMSAVLCDGWGNVFYDLGPIRVER